MNNWAESSALKQKYNKISTHTDRYIEVILHTGRKVQLTVVLFHSVKIQADSNGNVEQYSNSRTQPEHTVSET